MAPNLISSGYKKGCTENTKKKPVRFALVERGAALQEPGAAVEVVLASGERLRISRLLLQCQPRLGGFIIAQLDRSSLIAEQNL
jgi:hypothetical protein